MVREIDTVHTAHLIVDTIGCTSGDIDRVLFSRKKSAQADEKYEPSNSSRTKTVCVPPVTWTRPGAEGTRRQHPEYSYCVDFDAICNPSRSFLSAFFPWGVDNGVRTHKAYTVRTQEATNFSSWSSSAKSFEFESFSASSMNLWPQYVFGISTESCPNMMPYTFSSPSALDFEGKKWGKERI